MKTFLSFVTIGCFIFAAFASASVHTLIEAQIQIEHNRIIAATYISLPLKALTEIDI